MTAALEDNNRTEVNVATKRGTVLNGVLFTNKNPSDTLLIAITGILGNFYTNPFYYNLGDAMTEAGYDFLYAQTNDAFEKMKTENIHTGKEEIIGSYNERFSYTTEDIDAYLTWAVNEGYQHIYLGGHSLGANKVIRYLAEHKDSRVEHFFIFSPANLGYMRSAVTNKEKATICWQIHRGRGDEMLPFPLMGWIRCTADTAYDWIFSDYLNVVHLDSDGDFSAAEKITHTGALLIGTFDTFCGGDPDGYLENINNHMPTAKENKIIYIQNTGHTYQQKEQEFADKVTDMVQEWRENSENK